MQPIPTPQVLDPDRLIANNRGDFTADHKSRSELLDEGLKETCDYAQQLWHALDGVRGYLLDSLPPDPRSPEAASRPWTSPTGPDDEPGWQRWIAEFSAVTSVLCGPNGDSGYGLREAQHAAEIRRTAPTLRLHAKRPELPTGSAHPSPAEPAPSAPSASSAGSAPAAPSAPSATPTPSSAGLAAPVDSARSLVRIAGTAVLVLLAARGLRPRRG